MKCNALLRTLAMVGCLVAPTTACMAEEPETRLEAVPEYGYQVVSKVRFDRQNFTQGLEIYNGRLYVSSGLYGKSMVRAYDFPSLDLLREVPVDRRIFAEGLTVIDDRLILLSWRERVMLVYDLPDL